MGKRAFAALVFAFVACLWLNQSVSVEAWRPIRDRVWHSHDASTLEILRYPFTFLYRRSGDERIYHATALAIRGLEPDREFMHDARKHSGPVFERELPPADGHFHAPYTEVPIEYPPLALPFLLAPSYVSTSLQGYSVAFGVEMGLLLLLAAAWVQRTVRFDADAETRAYWLGTIALLVHGAIAVQRLDALVALSIAAIFWAWVRGRHVWLGVALGVAGALKLLPLLLIVPIFGADPSLRARPLRTLLAATATCGVGLGSLALFGPGAAATFFDYHRARGLHAESFAATLLALVRLPTSPVGPAQISFGSFNLDDPSATRLAAWSTPLSLMAMFGFALWCARRRPADSAHAKGRVLVAGICVLLLGAKVLSPQYLTWLLPLVVLLPTRALPWAGLSLFLSQLYFRGYFDAVYGMTPLGIGTLLARDLALLLLLITSATQRGSCAALPNDDRPDRRSSSRT